MIEFELENYDYTKEELDALKEDFIGRPPLPVWEQDNVQRTMVSDPTYSKAVELTTNATILYMERTLKAIDRALLRLDEIHNEIFEHRYRKRKNWRQTVSELYITEDMYFRKRRELILAVAAQLGVVNPCSEKVINRKSK